MCAGGGVARRRPRFSGPERGSELTSSWPGKGSAQPRRGDESGPSVLGAAEAPEERRRGWGQEGAAQTPLGYNSFTNLHVFDALDSFEASWSRIW